MTLDTKIDLFRKQNNANKQTRQRKEEKSNENQQEARYTPI